MSAFRRIAAVSGLALPAAAHACTVCHSHAGELLRAGILNGHFLQTLGMVSLPCPLLAAAVAAVYFGMPDLRPNPVHSEPAAKQKRLQPPLQPRRRQA